ncbi:FMN-binding negative transcriptional regulator [Pedobacter sp. HMF7647]|uniref:FMN-binding negative transcriptional regulator n=1 Tax=Hufsiella arboris TaxID=2695275 RepID=A0A7K1Y645_9SPHI|nr:FMN-binding negative transcriptional regulator [Hufsiella arboris]MXV50045.1 FMN-binding negative transcriptional regulator [Hufsiella arboris]
MYIPRHFKSENLNEAIAFMQRYSFGTIVTSSGNLPIATHLPFLVTQRENDINIASHFAVANPQALQLDDQVLVIFTEPHAYISPKFYEKEQSVPTWNYLAVHAYGKAKIIKAESEKFALLERTIKNYEQGYLDQWNSLSGEYKTKMLKGIVAFEITVTDLQFKKKLSQNKTSDEQQKIISEFSKSFDQNENLIADYMNRHRS